MKINFNMKHIITIIIIIYAYLGGQDKGSFTIQLLNERNYPMIIDSAGVYNINIEGQQKSIFTLAAITGLDKPENIIWTTKDEFYWSDSIKKELSPIINPSIYTRDGAGYSTIELLPKMKGMMILIYGHYYDKMDSIYIFIK